MFFGYSNSILWACLKLLSQLSGANLLGQNSNLCQAPVCDGTQNLERYRYRYFFWYHLYLTKISSGTKFSDTSSETFFWYQFCFVTASDTFLRYQIFPIPVPRQFSGTNFLRYHQRKLNIPGTGNSQYWYVTLCQAPLGETGETGESGNQVKQVNHLNEVK